MKFVYQCNFCTDLHIPQLARRYAEMLLLSIDVLLAYNVNYSLNYFERIPFYLCILRFVLCL